MKGKVLLNVKKDDHHYYFIPSSQETLSFFDCIQPLNNKLSTCFLPPWNSSIEAM